LSEAGYGVKPVSDGRERHRHFSIPEDAQDIRASSWIGLTNPDEVCIL